MKEPPVDGSPAAVADAILEGATTPYVVISPMLRGALIGNESPFFVVATSGPDEQFRSDQIFGPPNNRFVFVTEVMRRAPPLVVINVQEDELVFIKLCEKLWPGPEISAIRQDIEERLASVAKDRSKMI